MTVTRLYYPDPVDTGQILQLDKNASHHLVRVMRCHKDAAVTLFNGDGCDYTSVLIDDNPKQCTVRVVDKITTQRESPLPVTLLQGISRGDRMDMCIQKSTELGVNTIIPVDCTRSNIKLDKNRSEKKHEHWQQIIISACEQSGRNLLPKLHPITTYTQAVTAIKTGMKFVLDPESTAGLKDFTFTGDTVCLLAGPEGGLTTDEIRLARDNGFSPVRLGPRILRTETAGPASISAIQTLWGDLG